MDTRAYYWWTARKPHESVFPYLKMLDQNQSYRQMDNLKYMRLYGSTDFLGLNAYNYTRTESSYAVQNRVTLNVCHSMVDTAVSKLSKNKPRPYFLTDGGDWSQQRRAEKLTKFSEGQFYATNFYELMNWADMDAGIFGTGCIKIFRDGERGEKIAAERVFIDELTVDDVEAYYGKPRQMHQRKWVHKDVLAAKFPKDKGAIHAAVSDAADVEDSKDRRGDMLLVVESWRLPSSAKSKDGKHTICIANCTLFEESYTKDYFPFYFTRWQLKPVGFWGMGIVEQLVGVQTEINKILRTIQVAMHLVSVPKLFVEASSKIVDSHLNNKIGGIIKYVGTMPKEGQLGHIAPELFQQLNFLYNKCYEIIGMSQMSVQGTKPAGLNSGKALRTYNDIESERFAAVQSRREQSALEAAKIMIDLAKDIAAETGDYSVKVPGSGFLKTINWADVDMEDDQYIMQSFPTNALSQTPQARFQEVQELLQAGFVSKEDGMKLLDFPDLKAYYNMTNSGVEDIERQIELMVDKNEYQTPEPYQNLEYGIKKMQQAYLMYRTQGAPDETLDLFRSWIEDAKALLDQAAASVANQQAAAAQAALPPQEALSAPTGVPAAPPVSELLPSAPGA